MFGRSRSDFGGGFLRFGFDRSGFGFRQGFRLRYRLARGNRWNFRGLSGTEACSAFLRFGFPIGASEPFCSGEIPSAGVHGISGGLKISCEFEGHHGVARFGK
jgi:hypothetical protein